jgi:hypothetical protein
MRAVRTFQASAISSFAPSYIVVQQSRILESATRRYLAAVRELARVRKLQGTPPVRANAPRG